MKSFTWVEKHVDISDLIGGVYFIEIIADNRTTIRKIVKK